MREWHRAVQYVQEYAVAVDDASIQAFLKALGRQDPAFKPKDKELSAV